MQLRCCDYTRRGGTWSRTNGRMEGHGGKNLNMAVVLPLIFHRWVGEVLEHIYN